ncbi:hypothetical protein JM93_03007 [Roseibium hamelinense]|uniref:Uncharacterized protein n=1 Tax=Roseibium hamelinense TaxID=150831 RepID=A0A562SU77_9HYPH|nr:hypothetical protein [Roseibium hamelinense]MTI43024.1 hypothetical protein [Roseibium hamelinense]TWI84673.1 hypothetical protein JM93_03007 [Roseibium hamelinense]
MMGSGSVLTGTLACAAIALWSASVQAGGLEKQISPQVKLELIAGDGSNGDLSLEELKASATERFMLIEADGDYLRLDKLKGTVSYCQESNDSWRCLPAPFAEQAYEAEIEDLAAEIDELTASVEDAEAGRQTAEDALETARETIASLQEDLADMRRQLSERSVPRRPGSAVDGTEPLSSLEEGAPDTRAADEPAQLPEDEEELERILSFSESAMRRFFGLMKELQQDFDQDQNGG